MTTTIIMIQVYVVVVVVVVVVVAAHQPRRTSWPAPPGCASGRRGGSARRPRRGQSGRGFRTGSAGWWRWKAARLPSAGSLRAARDANVGRQLAGGNSSWCPELESRTTRARAQSKALAWQWRTGTALFCRHARERTLRTNLLTASPLWPRSLFNMEAKRAPADRAESMGLRSPSGKAKSVRI